MEEEEVVRPNSHSGRVSEVVPTLEFNIQSLRGSGQPLPGSARTLFEPRFGYDFSRKRIHTDKPVAETARLMNARPFTIGWDVVFKASQYSSGSKEGKRLLAHELMHVVRQDNTRVQREIKSGNPNNMFRDGSINMQQQSTI